MDDEKIRELFEVFSLLSNEKKINIIFALISSEIIAKNPDVFVERIKKILKEEMYR